MKRNDTDIVNETDPRLPSGEWRSLLAAVVLHRSLFHGASADVPRRLCPWRGADAVSDFTLRGRYDLDSGEVTMHKRYIGQHDVFYRGFAEGVKKGI